MHGERLLSISEFAALAAISRKNLIFYDEIGLFSPSVIGKNRYRYYTYRQLQTVNVIWALREIGVPLKEIKTYLDRRTPDKLVTLCRRETERLQGEITKLRQILDMMHSIETVTENARKVKAGRVEVIRMEARKLVMGPAVDKSDDYTISNSLVDFYGFCARNGLIHSYPVGSVTSREDLLAKKTFPPSRFFCPAKDHLAEEMTIEAPAGLYAVGYDRGDYGGIEGLYRKVLRHIEKNGYAVAGDGYEEYVLNEIAVRDPAGYLARVSVPVKRRRVASGSQKKTAQSR